MCVAYMIPVLGFVTWTLAGVFGLGAVDARLLQRLPAREPEAAEESQDAAAGPAARRRPSRQGPAFDVASRSLTGDRWRRDGAPPRPTSRSMRRSLPPPDPVAAAGRVRAGDAAARRLSRAARGVRARRRARHHPGNIFDFDHDWEGQRASSSRSCITSGSGPGRARRSAASSASSGSCASTARMLRFADALVRGLTGIFSLAVLGLGFLWILQGSGQAGLARSRRRHLRRQGAAQLADLIGGRRSRASSSITLAASRPPI